MQDSTDNKTLPLPLPRAYAGRGRPALSPDGRAMTAAERKARSRALQLGEIRGPLADAAGKLAGIQAQLAAINPASDVESQWLADLITDLSEVETHVYFARRAAGEVAPE